MKKYILKEPPPPPHKPRLTVDGAREILAEMEATLLPLSSPEAWAEEDAREANRYKAICSFLRIAGSRLKRGDLPEKALDYAPIKGLIERDPVALVRQAMIAGFDKPLNWGWQVIGDRIEWVSRQTWEYVDEVF